MHPGENVGIGKDHTLYSLVAGKVSFEKVQIWKHKYKYVKRQVVSVIPEGGQLQKEQVA